MVCYVYNDLVYRSRTNLINQLTSKSIVYQFQNDYQVIDYFREKKKKKNQGKIIFEEFLIPVRNIISPNQLRINNNNEQKKLVIEEIIQRNREQGIQKMKRCRENLKYIILKIRLEMPHIYLLLRGYYFYKFKDDMEFRYVVNKWCDPLSRSEIIDKCGNISFWDTSNVTDMKDLFKKLNRSYTFKDFDISAWNVSKVKNMNRMFEGFTFFNCDLKKWDVSNVETMGYMFSGCANFNKPLNWNTKNVKNMEYMLNKCYKFNSEINMNLSQVRNLNGFLSNCYFFNQPLEHLDVSNCKTMKRLLNYCKRFDHPLNNWNVENVRDMSQLFEKCHIFNQPLDQWNIQNVKNMKEMFSLASSFNQDLTIWDISKVIDKNGMFDFTYKMEKKNQPN